MTTVTVGQAGYPSPQNELIYVDPSPHVHQQPRDFRILIGAFPMNPTPVRPVVGNLGLNWHVCSLLLRVLQGLTYPSFGEPNVGRPLFFFPQEPKVWWGGGLLSLRSNWFEERLEPVKHQAPAVTWCHLLPGWHRENRFWNRPGWQKPTVITISIVCSWRFPCFDIGEKHRSWVVGMLLLDIQVEMIVLGGFNMVETSSSSMFACESLQYFMHHLNKKTINTDNVGNPIP